MKNERLLDGEKVTLVRIYDYYSTPKVCGMMGGRVDGKTVLDENGKPMPFSKIGDPVSDIYPFGFWNFVVLR